MTTEVMIELRACVRACLSSKVLLALSLLHGVDGMRVQKKATMGLDSAGGGENHGVTPFLAMRLMIPPFLFEILLGSSTFPFTTFFLHFSGVLKGGGWGGAR